MRLILAVLLVIMPMMMLPADSLACQFNTDCQPGSQCIKKAGSIYGVCMGGLSPGNTYDDKPVYAPLDINRTYGNTCQFNTDCGPGSVCAKSSGNIYGTCVRGR